ncbi:MAG: PKD domain-containing protein [Bacteroidota bacterium]
MKKIILISICVLGSLFSAYSQQFLSVSGTVTQISTNLPVPNHTVTIYGDSTAGTALMSTQTNASGYYSFAYTLPPSGTAVTLYVRTEDCQNYSHVVSLISTNTPLVANFQICYNPVNPCSVQFLSYQDSNAVNTYYFNPVLNSSANHCSLLWTFGDGTTSTNFDPSHHYQNAGAYNVCLTVADSVLACTATYCDSLLVGAAYNCHAGFNFVPGAILVNELHFSYTGTSTANTQYAWSFGDGTSSTLQNPTHTYPAPYSTYTVCVTITETNCTDTYCDQIAIGNPPCNISFSWLIDSSSSSGYTYQFYPSVNSPSSSAAVVWTFPNGTTSSLYNPSFTFPMVGNYLVCMSYNNVNTGCTGSVCDTVVIDTNNTGACHAGFTVTVTGQEAHFTYTGSASANNQYSWSFGDGTGSTLENPTHVYSSTTSTATACLTIYNGNCQDSYCLCFVLGNPQNTYQVSGMVTVGPTTPADIGNVILYEINTSSTPFVVTQTTSIVQDSSGYAYYTFSNLPNGSYLAKAMLTPNSQYYLTTLPTYHESSLEWNTADLITVNGNNVTANIHMILGNNSNGNGSITGNVVQGGSKGPGDAIANVEIVLLNEAGSAVKYTTSASNGSYSFSNLAYGTYRIIAEIAGLTCAPYTIVLSSTNTTASNVIVTVNTTNAVINGIESSIQANSISEIFPNPSTGDAYINMVGNDNVKINIYNASGLLLSSNEYSINGSKRITLNSQQLPIGVYTVCIENNQKNNIYRKLIISK